MWGFGCKSWLLVAAFCRAESWSEPCTSPSAAPTDYLGLSALYHSAGGADWSHNKRWLDGYPCARKWKGVKCNESRVVSIDLAHNNMKGVLPSQLGVLRSLTRGNFSRNSALNGTLPSQLGHLSKLRGLNFANVAPNTVINQKNIIEYFKCKHADRTNPLACVSPSSNSTNFLPSTGMSGMLPSELGALLEIEILEMGNCHYTSIPSQLGKLTTLRSIGLEHNKIRGTVPTELGLASKLDRVVAFQNSGLSGPIPSEIGLLESMKWGLNFANCAISASLPTEIGALSNIEVGLGLRSNNITGAVPTQIGNLIRTKVGLAFDYNRLSSSLPSQLGRFTAVGTGFTFMHNHITGRIPTELGKLSVLGSGWGLRQKLRSMIDGSWIGGLANRTAEIDGSWVGGFAFNLNSLSGSMPTELGMLTSLYTGYTFCNNSLNGTLPTQLGKMSLIRSGIGALSNYLTGPLPTELGKLSALELEFNFNTNSINGSFPTQIGALSNFDLRFFMHSNRLSSTLPTELGKLVTDRKLYLQNNSFTGSLPSQIGKMVNLEQLFLQDNKLDSSMPTELGLLTGPQSRCLKPQLEKPHRASRPCGLRYMVIDHNRFDGTLPPEMCKLKHLVVFSAYKNSLSGLVPNCTFPEMTYFNLARNDFHGKLPCIKGWNSVNYMLLHKNRFDGSLASLAIDGPFADNDSRNIYLSGNLEALTLHNNRLNRPLPKNLFLPPTLNKFTISYNKIPGTVPKALLAQLAGSPDKTKSDDAGNSKTILMSNNRLSCKLPKLNSTELNLDSSSLILVGNLFSWRPPEWVRNSERDSKFLSTAVQFRGITATIQGQPVPMWFGLLLQFAVVFIITAAALLILRHFGAGASVDNFSVFMRRCAVLLALFTAGSLVCLVPIFYHGGNYFQCGDPLMKYSTIAYMADSKVLEGLAAALLAAYTFGLALMLESFVPAHTLFSEDGAPYSGSKDVTMSFAQDFDDLKKPLMEDLGSQEEDEKEAEEEKAAAEQHHDETQDMHCFIYEWGLPHLENLPERPPESATERKEADDNNESPVGADDELRPGLASFSLNDGIRRAPFVAKLKCVFYVMTLIMVLLLLGGVPTVLWIMTYSLPTNNTLKDSEYVIIPWAILVVLLNKFLAFYLAVFSSFMLPNLTTFAVRKVLITLVGQASMLSLHKLQTTVSIVSRTVLVIIIPCVAVIYFNDGCFHKWRKWFWKYCAEDEMAEDEDSGVISVQYNEYVGVDSGKFFQQQGGISLDFSEHLKHSICDTGFGYGNACARDVLSVLGPLMIEKMIYVLLFSSVFPLMPWALRFMARVRRLFGCEGMSRSRDAPLNPMKHFMNLETALVFGGMVPLLLPLMALQLWVDTWSFEWLQSSAPSQRTLPVSWRGMQCHSVLVLVLHSMLLIFVFWESNLKGKYELTVVVVVILSWFLVAASWRVSMFDILRFRF